ncbi:hypothetical protein CCACVL1_04493 [Corchorus capsularis]|uniref:Uncharacterized protein n=1 Tax=Corchorus capsularis TaxID=210143 RepID=A0A1R3JS50_COCAP|nr:hypothetical protein CCACVL1_04493 [Corchorus capsularis]
MEREGPPKESCEVCCKTGERNMRWQVALLGALADMA